MVRNVYLGARSAALRGTLLDRGTLEKLAESTSMEELVNRLKGTQYSNEVSKLQPPYSARALELAFRSRLAEVHYLLMSSAPKYTILYNYYLRNVGWNLKSSLKSKALGRSYEETVEYINLRVEELIGRRELIVRVLAAKDLQEAATMLADTEFGADIQRAVSAYLSKGEIRIFDIYIDHAVLSLLAREYSANAKIYTKSGARDVAGIEELVSIDIDSYNILSILRSKLWGLQETEIKELMVTPTFKATYPILARMITADSVIEAARQVEGLYGIVIQSPQSDESLIDSIEDGLMIESKRTAERTFYWQGLGLSYAVSFLRLLEFEVMNLAAIAVGIETHMQAKDIISKLRL